MPHNIINLNDAIYGTEKYHWGILARKNIILRVIFNTESVVLQKRGLEYSVGSEISGTVEIYFFSKSLRFDKSFVFRALVKIARFSTFDSVGP